jgi:transposase
MLAADNDTPTLPEDPAALRVLLLETLAKVDTLSSRYVDISAERDALAEQNEHLRHLLAKLQRRQFGRKSEQLTDEQLQLAFEEIEATLAENAAEAGKQSPALRDQQKKRRRAGRGRLPAQLPRIEQVLAPEATACPCCQGPLVEIGVDAAERLDVIPAQFRVIVTKRPKLACRACPGVVLQAAAPARLIEGGMPTEATVAHVLVARYADHLPLYRQAQILARQGIEIGRAILADWTGTAAREIVPVVRRMHEILLASPRLFADETTMPVLDPGRGQTKKGFAWAIARDDRPWGGTDPPAVVFHYAPGRGAKHPKALLADYQGILQCDGYSAYKTLAAANDGITLAFCWSHTPSERNLAMGRQVRLPASGRGSGTGMTCSISMWSSCTMMRSTTSFKIACRSAMLAVCSRAAIRELKAERLSSVASVRWRCSCRRRSWACCCSASRRWAASASRRSASSGRLITSAW